MPGGRPPKWTDPEVLEKQGMAWINKKIAEDRPLTITGLAIELDTTRRTLMDYENRENLDNADDLDSKFSHTVKRLKSYCERYAEEQIFIGKNQAGSIFALKNYGWRDKFENDITSNGKQIFVLPGEVMEKNNIETKE